MRTTVRLDPEVYAEAKRIQHEQHVGLGEAVNMLAKAGLARKSERKPFVQRSMNLGTKIDVTNIGEMLAILDEEEYLARQ